LGAGSVGVALIVLAALLVGCGGSQESPEQQRARATVDRLQDAVAEGDFETACGLMTAAGRQQLGRGGHFDAPICFQDIRGFAIGLRAKTGSKEYAFPAIAKVETDGDAGTVTLSAEDGVESRIPLRRLGGQWKIDALYGDLPPATKRRPVSGVR
jgi:hypothetical protein